MHFSAKVLKAFHKSIKNHYPYFTDSATEAMQRFQNYSINLLQSQEQNPHLFDPISLSQSFFSP